MGTAQPSVIPISIKGAGSLEEKLSNTHTMSAKLARTFLCFVRLGPTMSNFHCSHKSFQGDFH